MIDAAALLRARNARADAPALACVRVFGCQQNEADGEKLRGQLLDFGYGLTDDTAMADVVVFNTCAVRGHAEQRVLGNIGALSHTRKQGQIVVVCGCMAQQKGVQDVLRKSYPLVSLVFGPALLPRFAELLWRVVHQGGRHFHLEDATAPVSEGVPVLRSPPPRAWITVMQGCDNFCSYCVVPYVRGRERSRAPENILAEASALIADGYTELFLLGQNVNSYRPDDGTTFAGLLRALNELDGDFSIRFMTSHPKDAGSALFQAMAECRHVAPMLHLPVQSGSDRILLAMNRGYTRERYLSLVAEAREAIPGLNLTSDIIVGFPGESEEDFDETLSLVRAVRFDSLFTFLYSKREGTSAARLEDHTPERIKKERFQRLLELQKEVEHG